MAIPVLALALSAFEDATHGNRYEEGQAYGIDKGRFANFEAAGLMRKLTEAEVAKLPPHGDVEHPATPGVKFEGHTIKITGPLKVDGNLTVPAKPAPRKRTRAAKK
jgi:hypothetical protein